MNLNAIKISIYEKTLTDGSKVYGVLVGGEVATLDCATEAEACELAEIIHRYSMNTEFDGAIVQRAA